MKFLSLVAFRYIFSKKRHNTINLITTVSMGGVAIGTFAIIVIMSVINGLEQIAYNSFSSLDPHIKISTNDGKTFSISDNLVQAALENSNIVSYNECIEHEGMMTYAEKQSPVIIKGVSSKFNKMFNVDSLLHYGDANFEKKQAPCCILGIGLSNTLNLGVQYSYPATIYTAKRNTRINLSRPESAFLKKDIYVCGVLNMRQEKYNEQGVIVPIEIAHELFSYNSDAISYIEIMIKNYDEVDNIKKQLKNILGDKFIVANRKEQQAEFYKILQIEKWVTFLILSFILLVATFNVIGSLSMIMIEKKGDISLFHNLGANKQTIISLFTFTGWLITSIGALIGITLGALICLIQSKYGIIKFGIDYMEESYPMNLYFSDCLLIMAIVLTMGFITSYYPVRNALKDNI